MAIISENAWKERDIFLHYDAEGCFVRYDFRHKVFFVRDASSHEEYERPYSTRIVSEAILYGTEINQEEYYEKIYTNE